MASRIGVDIGGTFTDLTFYDEATGAVQVAKTATTPEALEEGVLQAVAEAVPPERIGEVEFFMHGTTVALNALLTRSGARTGLICTQGFRDVVEIGRGDRAAMYDIFWRPPPALVPRRDRLTVSERIRADGEVLTPLVESDVAEALRHFVAAEIEAIAVCLMNAYANPVHEQAVARALRAGGFSGEIALSHELSREYREFERSSTTIVDAYIRPVTANYIEGLIRGLTDASFSGEVLVTRSGGGAITASELQRRPFEAIQSGPVAGAEGAAELCRRHEWPLAITADVGGTSFDTALILDGRPQIKHEGSIEGWPIQTSWVDVVSIGAGGGSVAHADAGLLRVGPRSAGAVPGPACYSRGGSEPTVTDAALLTGMLGDGVLGQKLRLDIDASRRAIEPLAAGLGLTHEAAAQGVLAVTTSAMAEAIREITIGQGEDPREARLIAFGGAGPLFGTLLAVELDVAEVIVPPYAGNFSAFGLLGQDVTHEAARTVFGVLAPELIGELNEQLDLMFQELAARDKTATGVERIVRLDLRYVGQEHTLEVQVPSSSGSVEEADLEPVRAAFESDYERRFGTSLTEELELVTVRATTRRELGDRAAGQALGGERTGVERAATATSYSFTADDELEFAVHERADLEPGVATPGPAIIFEPTATTYVDDGFTVTATESSALSIIRT